MPFRMVSGVGRGMGVLDGNPHAKGENVVYWGKWGWPPLVSMAYFLTLAHVAPVD